MLRRALPLVVVAMLVGAASAALSLAFGPRHARERTLRALSEASGVSEPPLGHPISIEDPSGHALDALYAALRRAERGDGQAHLVFYGGSHTAGDSFTGRMREELQARFGDAGHGFVPLVPVVVNHWAWGMVIDPAEGWAVTQVGRKHATVARYGIAGVEFTSDEPEAFAAVSSDFWGSGREASRLDAPLRSPPRAAGTSRSGWTAGGWRRSTPTTRSRRARCASTGSATAPTDWKSASSATAR